MKSHAPTSAEREAFDAIAGPYEIDLSEPSDSAKKLGAKTTYKYQHTNYLFAIFSHGYQAGRAAMQTAEPARTKYKLSDAERAALLEAGKTGATFAEMDGGAIMFINRGEDYGHDAEDDNACPACGGSGHKDDAAPDRAPSIAPAATGELGRFLAAASEAGITHLSIDSAASWDACRAIAAKVRPTDAERDEWRRERDCTLCGGMGDISDDGSICPHCNRSGKEPSIDSAAGWVSVSEKLPEQREVAYQVIAACVKQYPKESNYPGQGIRGVYQDWVIRQWPQNFTHWMPLPAIAALQPEGK